MGSEQSTGAGAAARTSGQGPRHGAATPVSPQSSICSDTDVPYVSYTQSLPIGDVESPRASGRRSRHIRPARRSAPRLPREIVVVRAAEAHSAAAAASEEDPELSRLRLIPMFLPVMRGALALPGARDPDVLDRLDSAAVRQMAGRLQNHLAAAAETTAAKQADINAKIAQLDQQCGVLLSTVSDRQRAYARHAERLQRIPELQHQLQRCQLLLDDSCRQLQQLNQQLPEEHRLQAFMWTSG